MKKTLILLGLLLGLFLPGHVLAQTEPSAQKMSVNDRLIKARAAKAYKKSTKAMGGDATLASPPSTQSNQTIAQTNEPQAKTTFKTQKATPADYKSPVDKTQHGPNGELIYTGARGAKYYINKNGNKTYLSSNL
ncbi:hypothetical protein [Spirosoma endophyticum]|uniref:Colicin import membrane protein n=1 Tax=Spirosoma endophyticum TaxID=662367 RepID=A0A1I2EAC6_9BACT|nr:hypothetical protein [Spirosoma endophyticum]SFE89805.1 colicin import membrane protein [Spirosoma endophyticum]